MGVLIGKCPRCGAIMREDDDEEMFQVLGICATCAVEEIRAGRKRIAELEAALTPFVGADAATP